MTFALYFGNRGFFPETLIASARAEIKAAVEAQGFQTLMLDENATRYGAVETAAQSVRLCPLSGSGTEYGAATRVDVYLWLEGCDPDCTNELCGMTLSNLSILFAGVSPEEAAA